MTGTSSQHLKNSLSKPYAAPPFSGIETWLNSPPLKMSELKGKVVLIDFWTYSCINCIRTLPYITAWDRKYKDQGLVIVGVHAPEFEFEKSVSNVQAAIAKHGIQYPVALDNRFETWSAFKNRYWPAHYLIDRTGQVVYVHFGEGQYAETEHNIRLLLGLNEQTHFMPEMKNQAFYQTPETYLGIWRAENFSSPETLHKGTHAYTFPAFLPLNHWALNQTWRIENKHIISQGNTAQLQLNFQSKKVYLVLGSNTGQPIEARILLNSAAIPQKIAGKDVHEGKITVTEHRLYELVNQPEHGNGLLEIQTLSPGLEAYAFTFGL